MINIDIKHSSLYDKYKEIENILRISKYLFDEFTNKI